ncbi:MAG: Beta-lactamase domain protein [Berkelbacteria bacterium GW2011_GWA1_39_10]|uniref:Ribonuclease J n=1 Tax=Berkelbacteria bacterium GW2011_GWA1_39_10 TaxID=1618332 RepID=A0A0G0LFA1_9BACT|nr:MAG: Beta-lactamase domain protein [Berkelbacteria bacterium GW2011_GWA1_39_10]
MNNIATLPQNGIENKPVKIFRAFTPRLRMIPLGGNGEIGKNMTIYEYGDDIIIVDCGIMFPRSEMLGIDFIIPNISYLEDRKDKIRGIVFTHGHEDHIGGIPYIWPKMQAPLYATKLTAGFIESKMQEFDLKPNIRVVKAGDHLQLGVFKIEFMPFSHTFLDDVGLIIDTPEGKVVHISDFKLDPNKLESQKVVQRLGEISTQKVKLLLLESTNVEHKSAPIAESVVHDTLSNIFQKTKGRLIVTSFASSLDRIQGVINGATRSHRKVAIAGRSMERSINIAMNLGYLKVPKDILVDVHRISNMPDDKLVVLCTGSQGEEYSALVRMSTGEHKQVRIKKGDTVVISAGAIPGNERSFNDTVNNLYKQGADVFYGSEAQRLHSSGHAKRDELKLVIETVKPEYFIPIHGEYRHLVLHVRLAQELGIPEQNTFVMEDGYIFEVFQGKARIAQERADASYVLVDGLGVGDVGNIVLRDRQAMAKDGIFVVILTVDHETGKIVTSPDIISRGFIYMREREDLVYKARQEVKKMFARHNEKYPANWDYIKKAMRSELGEFLYNETERRPMIIPVVIEV